VRLADMEDHREPRLLRQIQLQLEVARLLRQIQLQLEVALLTPAIDVGKIKIEAYLPNGHRAVTPDLSCQLLQIRFPMMVREQWVKPQCGMEQVAVGGAEGGYSRRQPLRSSSRSGSNAGKSRWQCVSNSLMRTPNPGR